MKTLVLNSSNIQSGNSYSDSWDYNFPGNASFHDEQISVSQISIYYSWRNISSTYGNNTFSYVWCDGTTTSVTIPDGYYSIDDLNAYLQSVMVSKTHYLVNSSGQYVYYLEFVTSSTYYSVVLNSYPVPTALPTGYSTPSGVTWSFPATAKTPQLVTTNSGFNSIIGFNSGTYPTSQQTTTYSKTSDVTPQVSPVNSLIVTCSLVSNNIGVPDNVIYSFSPNASYGSIINVSPPVPIWCDIKNGCYNKMTITIRDQNYNRVKFLDTQGIILLSVKKKSE